MADVGHDAILQSQNGSGVIRRSTALHRRTRVDVMLHVAVGRADVDLVPREVRVAEDDDIGVGNQRRRRAARPVAGPLS